MNRVMLALPILIFALFVGLLVYPKLIKNAEHTPMAGDSTSAFIGKQSPTLPVTTLPDAAQLTDADLRSGQVTVLNFWASWCPPCRAEHPVLKAMAADGIRVAGINMMDREVDASRYLAREGNPFFALATDPNGRNRVEWGVTNPPETFIIDGDGKVLFKFVGPLVGTDYETRFLPALQDALK